MSFKIPNSQKDLRSLAFELLLPVELNDTDIERLLTQVLERGVKNGRTSPSHANPLAYETHLDALSKSPSLLGFGGEVQRRVLDGWLRTSVVRMGRISLKRVGERLDYVRPLTIAAYRSGLPKSRSANRKIDLVVYRAMLAELRDSGIESPQSHLHKLFIDALGKGVEVGLSPWSEPHYDGTSDLDINELLAIRFIETFSGSRDPRSEALVRDEAVPGAVQPVGRDIVQLLGAFGDEWAAGEVVGAIASLTAIRMFQLPLRVGLATSALLNGTVSEDLRAVDADNPCEIYADFTRRRGGASDELARLCVARDLEVLRQSFAHRLMLRSISQACAVSISHNKVGQLPPTQQLRQLVALRDDPEVALALRMQIQSIAAGLDDSQASEEARHFLQGVLESGLSAAEMVTLVLVEALHKRGLENQVKWFWRTGGLTKAGPNRPYALLEGALHVRTSWRYAPSEELLSTLLNMCFIEPSGRVTSRLPLADLLERLESRFGILIDRPPASLDSPDARLGAAENLQAFRRQLQLLGCFEGLSDDFSAQYVTRPQEQLQ